LRRRRPPELLTVERARGALVAQHDPERKLDLAVGIAVGETHQRLCRVHRDAKLLGQLAPERLAFALPWTDLAAGKLPAPGHMLAGRALRDQYASRRVIERGGDHQDAHGEGALLDARERAVTVFVLLARAARTGLVATHLALVAHEGADRFR